MTSASRKKRPQIWWCIKNGNLLLPYTARTTRKQCVNDWVMDHQSELGPWNKPVKVVIEEMVE